MACTIGAPDTMATAPPWSGAASSMASMGRWCIRGSAVGGVDRDARGSLVEASSLGSRPLAGRRAAMAGRGRKQRGRGERRKKGSWAGLCWAAREGASTREGERDHVGGPRALLGRAGEEEGKSAVLRFSFFLFQKCK
jgi:hypothetical protein